MKDNNSMYVGADQIEIREPVLVYLKRWTFKKGSAAGGGSRYITKLIVNKILQKEVNYPAFPLGWFNEGGTLEFDEHEAFTNSNPTQINHYTFIVKDGIFWQKKPSRHWPEGFVLLSNRHWPGQFGIIEKHRLSDSDDLFYSPNLSAPGRRK